MDNDELIEGLRGIALAEPELGFAPDDVADRAARRVRDRRVALGTGLTVAVVAVAAVAFAANTGNTDTIGNGPTGQPPPSSGPAADGTALRLETHLKETLGGVLPRATEIKVVGPDASDTDSLTIEVKFRDDAGPAYFTLTVRGARATAGDFEPLASRCDPHPVDEDGNPVQVPVLANGKRLQCKKLPQPDGSTVVIEQTGVAVSEDLRVVRPAGLDAVHYRTDGSTVNIVNDDLVSVVLAKEYGVTNPDGTGKAGFRPRPPLSEQQLIALVTDPEFTLG
jgi:hypothetical protein